MAELIGMLGEKILTKDGLVDTASLKFAEDEVLGLYFSAHWCGPCRSFTPKLSQFYKRLNEKGPKLKIVFVSSDRSQQNFDEYYGEMPWYALPFDQTNKKNELNRKCKVSGIPTLALFSSTGKKLQTEGDSRQLVSEDPEGKNFPWPQRSLAELLTGPLTDKNNESSNIEDLVKEGYTIGFYFSAHWCPPCRGFTPQLVQTYQKVKEKGHKFEIIFASSDRDENSFKEYLDTMPWKAIPLKDPRKEMLSRRFDVNGIPMLVIISSDMKVITTNGRSCVDGDKKGENFPWNPKPLNSLQASTSMLNESPMVILFADGDDDEVKQIGNSLLRPVAEKLGNAAMPNSDEFELGFVYAGGDEDEDLCERIRRFAKLPKSSEKPSMLVILNIPEGQCYVHDVEIKTADDVQKVVDDFKAGELTFRSLQ